MARLGVTLVQRPASTQIYLSISRKNLLRLETLGNLNTVTVTVMAIFDFLILCILQHSSFLVLLTD